MSNKCYHCSQLVKSKVRDISDEVWGAYIILEEGEKGINRQPMCEDCYLEIRDTLIERQDEIDAQIAKTSGVRKAS